MNFRVSVVICSAKWLAGLSLVHICNLRQEVYAIRDITSGAPVTSIPKCHS